MSKGQTENISIQELCEETAKKLWNISENDFEEKLIFPTYSDGEIRISEQEARFFVCEIIRKSYFYSVETPTKHKYKFGDKIKEIKKIKNGRSGCIDVSIYPNKEKKSGDYKIPSLNIELKAHSADKHSIAKDLFKLMHEQANGLFFHLLKSTNNGTLITKTDNGGNVTNNTEKKKKNGRTGILTKFYTAFKELTSKLNDCNEEKITFAICCLEPKFLLMKTLKKSDLKNIKKQKTFFYIDFEKLKTAINKKDSSYNDWEIVLPKEDQTCK